MKKLSLNLLFLFLGLSVVLFTTSCGDGTGDGGETPTGPTVELLDGEGFSTISETLDAGASFKVQLKATPGENDIQSLTIYIDNEKLSTDLFSIEGVTSNNPLLVTGDESTTGFTYDITITAHDAGTATYDFEVAGKKGGKGNGTIDVSINETPMELTLNGPTSFTAAPGLTAINVSATKGGSVLSTIEVSKGGVLMTTLDDLRFLDVTTVFDNNPMSIPESSQDGFTGNVYIRTEAGENTYTITVTDGGGTAKAVSVTILGGNTVTTITGALLNSAGPGGTGGLDLDTGNGTGSSDALSELKDLGIDASKPDAQNWKQQIAPINGAILRKVIASQVGDNFTFDGVATDAEVQAAYDVGTDVTESDPVAIGDLFAVFANGKYYLLMTTNVITTATDNADQYEFSIKS